MGVFISVLCMLLVHPARAAGVVRINEILYDVKDLSDADHEWVELYNSGSDSVSLSGWKFNDGSNHTLNAPPANGGQGSLSIPAGGYAILSGNAATYVADHPGFVGTVIDTVMSLNNAGATLSLIDKSGQIEDTISYTSALGASGDGNTLSRLGETFIPTAPTPGYQNGDQVVPPVDTSSSGTTDGSTTTNTTGSSTSTTQTSQTTTGGLPVVYTSSTQSTLKTKDVPILVHIIAQNKSNAGVPFDITSKATGTYGEDLYDGRFVWSFGDGNTKTQTHRDTFSYVYQYSGEYVVYLEYYRYAYETKPDAIDRMTVSVGAPVLTVRNVYDDGTVSIANTGSQEIDLYQWSLKLHDALYTFPTHIIVLPQDSVHITQAMFGTMTSDDIPKIIEPAGFALTDDTADDTPSHADISLGSVNVDTSGIERTKKIISTAPTTVPSDDTQNKTSPVVLNDIPQETVLNPSKNKIIYYGFGCVGVLAIISSSVVWHERKKKILTRKDENIFSIEEIN